MRVLYVTTVGATMRFFRSFIKELKKEGHDVEIATNQCASEIPDMYKDINCGSHHIDCTRSPFSFGNLIAILQLRKLIKNGEYNIVHCHTPIASVCTRVANKLVGQKNKTNVIYTAHGFHFYKGAPLLNWLIYFPLEWICSWFTDTLITINKEDFLFAKKHLHAKDIEFVPGVGLEVKTFKNVVVNIAEKRMLYNISETDFVLLSVGELNTNKNHEIVIRAVAEMGRSDMHYIVAGKGPLESYLKKLALELGVEKQVHILGYRTDVAELYKIANLYVHPSFREGLPVAIMECLASGTPCITSNIRGCIDLVKEDYFDPTDVNDVISQIMKNYKNRKANVCLEETYHEDNINKRMKQIYKIGGANE